MVINILSNYQTCTLHLRGKKTTKITGCTTHLLKGGIGDAKVADVQGILVHFQFLEQRLQGASAGGSRGEDVGQFLAEVLAERGAGNVALDEAGQDRLLTGSAI